MPYTCVPTQNVWFKKENDMNLWNIFACGNFSINKSEIPFCYSGAKHALDQENRVVKVLGGIKVIRNNRNALKHFLRWKLSWKPFISLWI